MLNLSICIILGTIPKLLYWKNKYEKNSWERFAFSKCVYKKSQVKDLDFSPQTYLNDGESYFEMVK